MAGIRVKRLGLTGVLVGLASAAIGLTGVVGGVSAATAGCVTRCPASAAAAPAIEQLGGVSAVSKSNAWAVGTWARNTGPFRTLVEHWSGGRWRVQASPNPGHDSNQLASVVALAKTQAWAVGAYQTVGQSVRTLVEHWNGKSWKVQRSPSPVKGNNTLSSVAAVSDSSVWAVGDTLSVTGQQNALIEHWNGRSWSVQHSPSPGSASILQAVAAVSRSNVWAIGYYKSSDGTSAKTLVLHWNGTRWKTQASANPSRSQNYLCGVAATSATNAWVSGTYVQAGFQGPLMEHWNGKAWKRHASPQPSGYEYDPCSIAALSSRSIWAVGSHWHGDANRTLIEHWNGATWKTQKSPNAATGAMDQNVLTAVTVTSASNAWAAGSSYVRNSGHIRPLIEHWNGSTWKLQSAAIPG